LAWPAHAQFRVEVSGVGLTQIPMAIAPMRGEEASPQKISAIVQADLERSGQFRGNALSAPMDELARPDFTSLKQKGDEALLTGSVTKLADGRFDVRFRLWDVVRGQDLGGQSYATPTGDLRMIAHRISDFIYEKLTGEKGVFSTRIAYVTKQGTRFSLWVADADGENAQAALTSPEPIISPNWSPNGQELAYVSFEARKPVVYVHDVYSGKRRVLANFKGNNSAPSWAPDGKSLAISLSKDGNTQIYRVNADGSNLRRLTQGSTIDTEPQFSPEGKFVYFTSDRGGNPQIYRMSAEGERGEPARRISFKQPYATSARISPDGKYLAYIAGVGGGFKLHLMNLLTGDTTAMTDTSFDESPSFAANGRYILYATQVGGKKVLAAVSVDGYVKQILSIPGSDVRQPSWGPFMDQ
jgi:TolB protein